MLGEVSHRDGHAAVRDRHTRRRSAGERNRPALREDSQAWPEDPPIPLRFRDGQDSDIETAARRADIGF